MTLSLKAILVDPGTAALLRVNGEDDARRGIKMRDGWHEVAEACGYDKNARTPAREAYEDGWHNGASTSKRTT